MYKTYFQNSFFTFCFQELLKLPYCHFFGSIFRICVSKYAVRNLLAGTLAPL